MKISKIFAGMSAMALAATMLSVSASAAITNAAEDGSFAFDVANGRANAGLQDYFAADDIAAIKVVLDGDFDVQQDEDGNDTVLLWNAAAADGAGDYDGFGGGIIINHAAGWDQLQWGNPGSGSNFDVQWNEDETEFFFVSEISAFANPLSDEDLSAEEGTWGQVCVSQWWGGDFAIESVQLIDAEDDIIVSYNPNDGSIKTGTEISEAAAADALKELQDAYAGLGIDVDEVVASTNAAAEALGNTKAAVDNINAAIEKVNGLKAVLAKAQAAFDALKEGEVADTEAYETAKAAVEKATTDLETAQKALNDAIAEYDAKTAADMAAKDEQIATLESEKADLEKQLEDALAQGEADAATIEELQAQIAAKDEEIAKLKSDNDDLQTQLDDAIKNGGSSNVGSTGDKNDDKDANPSTGAGALATVGVLLAGAAIVASKRK